MPDSTQAPERPEVERRDRRNTFGTDTDPDVADDRPGDGEEEDGDWEDDETDNEEEPRDRPRR
jgi:hypothetical protein